MFPALALIGSAIIGGVMQSKAAKSAAKSAAAAQTQAIDTATQAQLESTRLSIEEQRRQYDAIQELFKPYVQAGGGALAQQLALVGIGGPEARANAIREIEMGPEFAAYARQGEEAMLQNAAATGGLRGGNLQGALAKFRPELLNNLINQQYERLGGISRLGQASAAGQAAQAQTFGANMAQLYGNQGQALANQAMGRGDIAAQLALARGQATSNMWGNIAGSIGFAAGQGLLGKIGSAPMPGGVDAAQAAYPDMYNPAGYGYPVGKF